jgi:hypothetical protein
MRRPVVFIFSSFLIMSVALIHKGSIHTSIVKASPSIYQGDLVLTGSNVTTIEGRFDINGSIIVEDNATLILRNAILNFTQTSHRQYEMVFQHPAHGNPRLLAENSTITANNLYMHVNFYGNTSIEADESSFANGIFAHLLVDSMMSVMNSNVDRLIAFGSSTVESVNSTYYSISTYGYTSGSFSNCTTDILIAEEGTVLTIIDCTVGHAFFIPSSANYSVISHEPGFVDSWNFLQNCSVVAAPTGFAPNVTLTRTWIHGWGFSSRGNSNYTIFNSLLHALDSHDFSTVHAHNSTISWRLWSSDSSNVWLLNSTSDAFAIEEDSRIYVCWYLYIHVVDSIGQDVPSANVTVTYPDVTVAESRLTNESGWAGFTLMEKMMNATGEYPIGNYTVEAAYQAHSAETTVNMIENNQMMLTLEDFVIPEFSSLFFLPLFTVATLLAALIYRRKRLTGAHACYA